MWKTPEWLAKLAKWLPLPLAAEIAAEKSWAEIRAQS
jgi:hypothetical protein